MNKRIFNNHGLTLIEVLAALVILGIVFIGFMTFFTQSAKITVHNKEKLTAVEVAEDVVGKIRSNNDGNLLTTSFLTCLNGAVPTGCSYTFDKGSYEVTVTESDSPMENQLKKLEITVVPLAPADIPNKPFKTEMYTEMSYLESLVSTP